jgi:hypothetical protein
VAFRALAVAASLATLAVVAALTRRLWPERAAFALAAFGLNPVVLFQSVGSGHNDLFVALSVAAALLLVAARRSLLGTAAITLGALVKATAGVQLLLLVVAAVAAPRVAAPRRRGPRTSPAGSHSCSPPPSCRPTTRASVCSSSRRTRAGSLPPGCSGARSTPRLATRSASSRGSCSPRCCS